MRSSRSISGGQLTGIDGQWDPCGAIASRRPQHVHARHTVISGRAQVQPETSRNLSDRTDGARDRQGAVGTLPTRWGAASGPGRVEGDSSIQGTWAGSLPRQDLLGSAARSCLHQYARVARAWTTLLRGRIYYGPPSNETAIYVRRLFTPLQGLGRKLAWCAKFRARPRLGDTGSQSSLPAGLDGEYNGYLMSAYNANVAGGTGPVPFDVAAEQQDRPPTKNGPPALTRPRSCAGRPCRLGGSCPKFVELRACAVCTK